MEGIKQFSKIYQGGCQKCGSDKNVAHHDTLKSIAVLIMKDLVFIIYFSHSIYFVIVCG